MNDDLTALAAAIAAGGVALVPTDTVYGLAAALDDPSAVAALYALKGRPRSQACQVLIYSPDRLADALAELPEAVAAAAAAVLPGTTTCLVPDPSGRYAAASGGHPGTVGLRAPRMGVEYHSVDTPLVATSANRPGGPDPRAVADVPDDLLAGVACVVDRGPLGGVASAVLDLRPLADGRCARLVRPGPDPTALARALARVGCNLDR